MNGTVRSRHVLLPVSVRLPSPGIVAIEFIVDTGFTGYLTLPPEAVATMGLSFLHNIEAQLADSSFVEVGVYAATIVWKNEELEVRVLATGARPLLGTALLDGSALMAEFREEGLVTVENLPELDDLHA